jgi:hypothetical protein
MSKLKNFSIGEDLVRTFIGEMNMIRNVYLMNLKALDALPRWERWYWRHHAPEVVRNMGPWLRRYESWRAIPDRNDLSAIGYYNYRWTELWFEDFEATDRPLTLSWYEGQDIDSETPLEDPYHGGWTGRFDGLHPIAQSWVPALPEIRIDNHIAAAEMPPVFRWIGLLRFPEGAKVGDRWFTQEVVPGLARTEGVQRIRTSRTLEVPEDILRNLSRQEPQQFAWQRFFEIEFSSFKPFIEAITLMFHWNAARGMHAHGIEPYRDLVSTITLERPDWTLHDVKPYG